MHLPDFSVLLLAWDDADPGVTVLGGAALPPTLPLVYQLAAHHPVLALYPHLPAPEATAAPESAAPTPGAPATVSAGAVAADAAASDLSDATAVAPGVRLLPTPAPEGPAAPPAASSRLVGLDDLLPATQYPLPTAHRQLSSAEAAARAVGLPLPATAAAPRRNQWPAQAEPASTGRWQAPAAPYLGAADFSTVAATGRQREFFPPPPPAPPRPASAAPEASGGSIATAVEALISDAPAAGAPAASPEAAPMPSRTATQVVTATPEPFNEPVAEIGAAEANDLSAPENDLVPDSAPTPNAATAAAPYEAAVPEPVAPAAPVPFWAVRQPALDGLNYRMIQYARQAAQLVVGQPDFGVIYAPGWPAWLAALEIRNRSGRPLVLYVPALASDSAPLAERGWLLGVERMALRRAALVLVPDADTLRRLRARHAEVPGEIRIVPAADEAAVQLALAEVALG